MPLHSLRPPPRTLAAASAVRAVRAAVGGRRAPPASHSTAPVTTLPACADGTAGVAATFTRVATAVGAGAAAARGHVASAAFVAQRLVPAARTGASVRVADRCASAARCLPRARQRASAAGTASAPRRVHLCTPRRRRQRGTLAQMARLPDGSGDGDAATAADESAANRANVEIERKFLVRDDSFRRAPGADAGVAYRQGYLCADAERTVRVRVAGARAFLTIKGKPSGASRAEYEYAIPVRDAEQMLDTLCAHPLIEKTRFVVPAGGENRDGLKWEVDVFAGANAGLTVAEIEVPHEAAHFARPAWLGAEVTGDARYYNSSLQQRPYSKWPAERDASQ